MVLSTRTYHLRKQTCTARHDHVDGVGVVTDENFLIFTWNVSSHFPTTETIPCLMIVRIAVGAGISHRLRSEGDHAGQLGCGVVKALWDFDGQIALSDFVETGDVAVDVVDVAVFVARFSVGWTLFLELGGDCCE